MGKGDGSLVHKLLDRGFCFFFSSSFWDVCFMSLVFAVVVVLYRCSGAELAVGLVGWLAGALLHERGIRAFVLRLVLASDDCFCSYDKSDI